MMHAWRGWDRNEAQESSRLRRLQQAPRLPEQPAPAVEIRRALSRLRGWTRALQNVRSLPSARQRAETPVVSEEPATDSRGAAGAISRGKEDRGMRRRARTDANHADVRDALRVAGWTVIDTSRAGDGFPDLVALKHGRIEFVEVKDGSKPPSERRLTAAEAQLAKRFLAAGVAVRIVTTIDEAVSL